MGAALNIPLLGRARELGELSELVADAARGVGGVVLLGGEPGIGKSRLAEAAAEMARAAGLASVWGRCREGAGAPPFWPWTQVVRALGTTVDWSPAGEQARFRLFAAVVDVLLAAARPAGLLVVLDDAHRADDSSLRLLGFLADQLSAAPLGVVVAYRDAEAGPVLGRLLTDLAPQRQCRRRVLGGLSLGAVAEWLAATSGVEVHRATEVHDRTGGNPFFVREVLRLLAEDAASGDIPVSVREVIGSRVAQLPPSARRAVEAAAVLGREFSEAALSALLAVGPDIVAGALQPAVAAHLIERGRGDGYQRRFVHALVPETVLADLEPGRRAALHARAFAVLPFSAVLEPSRIAHHALAARGAIPDDAVRSAVVEAARDADERLAWDEAAAWWRRAVELAGAVVPAGTVLALGQALLRSGRAVQARAELMAAVADARRRGDTTLLAEAALLVGDAVSDIAPDRSLLALLDEALAAHGLPVGTRVRLEARRAMVTFWTPGGVEAAREAAAHAVADGQAAGDDDALGAALIARQFTLRGPDDPAERIDFGEQVRAFAERRGDEELRFRACRWLIPDLFHRGELFAATTTLDVAAGIAEARRDPRQRWWVLVFRALFAGFRGRGEECVALACEARALGRRLGEPAADVYCVAQLFPEYRRTGRVGELEAELRTQIGAFPTLPTLSCMLTLLLADTGRVDDAAALLRSLAAPDALPRDQLLLASWAILGESAVALGDRSCAGELAVRLTPFARRNLIQGVPVGWGSTAWHLARLCRATGDETGAQRHAATASELHRRWGAGAWGPPLAGLAAAAGRELSARERQVVALLARGLTNKAIADALTLSVHTVERHVVNVLRKLDLANRGEVSAWAHRHGLVD